MHLYPDAADEDGKRVIIKCNLGPGRLNVDLLADLQNKGFILYPCVPNTTHITQETDISYGFFKHKFRHNLKKLGLDCLKCGKGSSIHCSVAGLLVFGGTDPVTNIGGCADAFASLFTHKKNRDA